MERQVKKKKWLTVFLAVSISVIILLIGFFTSIQLQEDDTTAPETSSASGSCNEKCPGADGVLRNCTPPDSDGSSQDSICDAEGRKEMCGGQEYCCSSKGGTWKLCSTQSNKEADLDGDGSVTILDFSEFVALYKVGNLKADFNEDGKLNIEDFYIFRDAYLIEND